MSLPCTIRMAVISRSDYHAIDLHMDDIPVPLPAKPEHFMDRLHAFRRAQHLAYRTEKNLKKDIGIIQFSKANKGRRILTALLVIGAHERGVVSPLDG